MCGTFLAERLTDGKQVLLKKTKKTGRSHIVGTTVVHGEVAELGFSALKKLPAMSGDGVECTFGWWVMYSRSDAAKIDEEAKREECRIIVNLATYAHT